MDKFEAVAAGVGYLTMAYVAGYPLYYFVGRPILWLSSHFERGIAWLEDMNAKMDDNPHFVWYKRDRK